MKIIPLAEFLSYDCSFEYILNCLPNVLKIRSLANLCGEGSYYQNTISVYQLCSQFNENNTQKTVQRRRKITVL